MSDDSHPHRRAFLRTVSKIASSFLAPVIVPSSALGLAGQVSPSDRITLGLIGCGGHGAGWNLDQIFRNSDAQVLAVCDVDRLRLEAAVQKVDEHQSRIFGRTYRACSGYGDFRELVNRRDLDVVANCTPDHWHMMPALMAVKTGKDVICEKPLTLTIEEGKILRTEVAKRKRIFQTASENRSIDSYIRMVELVRNGRIGRLQHIRVSLPSGNEARGENFNDRDEVPVPDYFDFERWLGQAPLAPYVPARCHGSFRWISDYSGGRLTDWGAHMIDLAQWGNNSESAGPVEVEGTGKFPPKGSLFNTAYEFSLSYRYLGGVTLQVVSEGPGIRFEGSDGWIGFTDWRGPLEASSRSILDSKIGPEETRLPRPGEVVRREDNGKGGEYRNFFDCVKSRRPCYAPAEVGHRTISIAHMGNIAMLLGRKLRWDPGRERFEGDDSANAMLARVQREPWTVANVDSWIV